MVLLIKLYNFRAILSSIFVFYFFLFAETIAPTTKNRANATIFTHTMLAPHGVSAAYEINIPIMNVTTETTAEQIVTDLKLLKILIEHSAGKMIRLEISILPISRIPITIVTAVSRAISIL